MVFALLLIAAAAQYLISVLMPKRAEHFREWLAPKLKHLEQRADQAPGILGSFLKGPFWASRKTLNLSTNLGEKTSHKANHNRKEG